MNSVQKPLIKSLLILGILLVSAIVVWVFSGIDNQVRPAGPAAVYDSRSWHGRSVLLNGTWEFYWSRFLDPGIPPDPTLAGLVEVPSSWTRYQVKGNTPGSKGFGTYRLVLTNLDDQRQYGLRISSFATSYRLFVNGRELGSNGRPGTDAPSTVPMIKPQILAFHSSLGKA